MAVIGTDPTLRPFAARLTDGIAGFLGESAVRVVSDPGKGAPRARLAFAGAVSGADGQVRVRLTLDDEPSGTTLWSRVFAAPAARADALIDEAKGGAMETVNELRATYGPSGPLLDPETTLLGLRGGEDEATPSFAHYNDASREFEQALARRPDSAVLRAAYSGALWQLALQVPSERRAAVLAKARAEAERTIREHPDEPGVGIAYGALLVIRQLQAPPRDWVGMGARLDAALKASPEDAFLYNYACHFLALVGRAEDSLYYCQRALSLRPHSAFLMLNYAQALDMAGSPQVADQLLDEGGRLFPDDPNLRAYRFNREAFGGSPDKALTLLRDPDTSPPFPPDQIPALELLQKARNTRLANDADMALAAARRADAHLELSDFRFLFPMALGRLDEAFASPDLARAEEAEKELLTLQFTAPLRRDPRYWPLAARAGLVRYWLTTNKWPDFCRDPSYPLDCREEAKRVLPPSPAAG
jgi:hypothetical protein